MEQGYSNAPKKILCLETGEVFSSIRRASVWLGVCPKDIRTCLNKGYARKGYHFTIVNEVKENE